MTWSDEGADEETQAILLQIYPILLSTLLSIGRNQLSLFDANFALTITSSPLTVSLALSYACAWFKIKPYLLKRIKSGFIVRTLWTSVLFLWFGLSVTLTLSNKAFINSGLCDGSTFRDWVLGFLSFLRDYILDTGFPPSSVGIPYMIMGLNVLLLFRCWRHEVKGAQTSGKLRSLKRAWYVPIVGPLITKILCQQGILSISTTHGLGTYRRYISMLVGHTVSFAVLLVHRRDMFCPMVRCGYLFLLLIVRHPMNIHLSGVVCICYTPTCHIGSKFRLFLPLGSVPCC